MQNGQTYAEVQDEVAARLGAGAVSIELDSRHYAPAFKQAIRVLNRYTPNHGRAALPASKTVKKYEITHTGLRGVVEVQFVQARLTSELDPFNPFEYQSSRVMAGMDGDTFADWDLQLMHAEQALKVASAEPEWLGQWEGSKYYLYISIPSSYLCSYVYSWGHTADDANGTGIATIDDGMIDWFLDFVEAKAKQTLGRIRSKFPITTPDGNLDIDGRDMIEQGRTDEARLLTDIKRRRRPLPPSIE